jgi:hypothetical protein
MDSWSLDFLDFLDRDVRIAIINPKIIIPMQINSIYSGKPKITEVAIKPYPIEDIKKAITN